MNIYIYIYIYKSQPDKPMIQPLETNTSFCRSCGVKMKRFQVDPSDPSSSSESDSESGDGSSNSSESDGSVDENLAFNIACAEQSLVSCLFHTLV